MGNPSNIYRTSPATWDHTVLPATEIGDLKPSQTGQYSISLPQRDGTYWWRGIVGNAFRLKRSYSTPGPVSTAIGDCLRAGKPSRCKACQLGQLSLLPSVGR